MLSREVAVSRDVMSFSIIDVYRRVRAICFHLQFRSVSGFLLSLVSLSVCLSGDHMALLARRARWSHTLTREPQISKEKVIKVGQSGCGSKESWLILSHYPCIWGTWGSVVVKALRY
jgi:hypothetical protein